MHHNTILIWLTCFSLAMHSMAREGTSPLPAPGTYPSDYICFGYPMVFEDGTLTASEKLLILNDYKLMWEAYPSQLAYLAGIPNDITTLLLPGGGEVMRNAIIYRERMPIPMWSGYEQEIGALGTISGFGYVLPISKMLSDAYRSKMQLPDFGAAYAALNSFFYTMSHLEETEYTKIGDIIFSHEEKTANMSIRYFIEAHKDTQFIPSSILNIQIGEWDLPSNLTLAIGVKEEGLPLLEWPIVYDNGRWKIYTSSKME